MNSVLDGRLTNNVHQRELVPHQETGGKLSQGFRDFQIFIISIMNYSVDQKFRMAKIDFAEDLKSPPYSFDSFWFTLGGSCKRCSPRV